MMPLLSRNVIGFPSIADHSVAKCMLLLLLQSLHAVSCRRVCRRFALHAGFLLHLMSSHHITSHSILFFVRSVGAAWLTFAGGSVRRASSCVRMHACGRVRGCSAFRFGPFTHGDGLGDGGVGNPPPRGKHMELNESCLCLWKYLLRDGWREGGKYFCTSTCSAGCEDIRLASGTGFRIQDAPSKGLNTYLPRDMPPSEQREKAGCVVCMQHQYTVRVAI
jgi:hypothetical protein